MIFEFYPWKIDIDVEATRQLYEENDYAEDKAFNRRLADTMTQQQKNFFSSLGVDIHKMRAEEKIHDIPEEDGMSGGKIAVQKIDFFLCGKFLAIPDYQQELYGDEEIAELQLPDALQIVKMPEENKLPIYDIDGWGCVFKHPYFRNEKCKKWDCGYVLGSILMMKDIS